MKRIGRYTVTGLLGIGGMARVYKARLPGVPRIIALKNLEPRPFLRDLMDINSLRELFMKEALVMARLQHPHLLGFLDYDQQRGIPFFTMEYYPNSLDRMMGESPDPSKPSRIIPLDRAVRYLDQILLGLACLHDHGIVHRDIKPFNILLTQEGKVKISDFGLSRLRGEVFSVPGNLKVGSPFYAAPEQEEHPDHAGPRADIYSVGVLFFRMVTGALPDAYGLPASEFNPDMTMDWDDFLNQCLNPDPAKRFATVRAMRKAMNRLWKDWKKEKGNTCFFRPDKTSATRGAPKKTSQEKPNKNPEKNCQRRFWAGPAVAAPVLYSASSC